MKHNDNTSKRTNNDNITTKNDDGSSTTTKRYSDNVFCLLYSDKHNLLDLYNALNNSSHTDVDNLTITTLKGGVYMKYKNDAITFYNGREPMKKRTEILRLSDMFEHPAVYPALELEVTVINLNYDNATDNSDITADTPDTSGLFTANILDRCQSLRDYMTFVNMVRYKIDTLRMQVRSAVIEAVDECIKDGVLSDFFVKHRNEVIDVSIFEYDEEGVMNVMREEGREEGRTDATLNGIRNIMNKLNKSADEAMDILDIPVDKKDFFKQQL